jgi:hypothetical protein
MRSRLLASALPLFASLSLSACYVVSTTPDAGDASADAGSDVVLGDGSAPETGSVAHREAAKVDLLFAIDNSASMGDKQLLLAQTVPDLLARLITPNCIDAQGAPIPGLTASMDGVCAQGEPEFAPVRDLHIGVVSSSLGGRGGDRCDGADPVGSGQISHEDDKGHLLNRATTVSPSYPSLPTEIGDELTQGHVTPDIEASSFLAWLPGGAGSDPGAVTETARLIRDFQEAVGGVHEYGCGIESQLESWYRFLIQPDPYASIVPASGAMAKRDLSGVDGEILKQRHDFLRPDSLVAIVLLTDEDDSTVDPRSVGGQGWAYANSKFPGKNAGTMHIGAPRGTSACDDPATVNTAACTSCGFGDHASDANCKLAGDGQTGYYPDAEDTLNTRFVRMKQRYGVDPQFPVSRYVNGLRSATVPDRRGELYDGVSSDGVPNGSYRGINNCTNPLFAQDLPVDAGGELCSLTPGPRTSDLVVFVAITGVPWQLLTQKPYVAGGEGAFLSSLPADRWNVIVGRDPNNYDYSGMDPHMVQSTQPRAGIAASVTADDTADPWHGREWDTGNRDLQYSCTFPLAAPKDCTDPRFAGACDCIAGSSSQLPLCDASNDHVQVRGKAYPGIRQLTLARDLGEQGIAASLCPRTLDPNSADYGYRPAARALVSRMAKNLAKNVAR